MTGRRDSGWHTAASLVTVGPIVHAFAVEELAENQSAARIGVGLQALPMSLDTRYQAD